MNLGDVYANICLFQLSPREDTWLRNRQLENGLLSLLLGAEPGGLCPEQLPASVSRGPCLLQGGPLVPSASWKVWLKQGLFTSSLYSAPTPISIPYHPANRYENGFQGKSGFQVTSSPNN